MRLRNISHSTFEGTDLSSPTRKRKRETRGQFGNVEVSYNYEQNDENASKEIFVLVNDALFKDRYAMVGMEPDEAMKMLLHLNTLLGNPLSHPPTAGGFAPSAD